MRLASAAAASLLFALPVAAQDIAVTQEDIKISGQD